MEFVQYSLVGSLPTICTAVWSGCVVLPVELFILSRMVCRGLRMNVTPWDGMLSSEFDGIIQYAVVLGSVCPELQALYVFI